MARVCSTWALRAPASNTVCRTIAPYDQKRPRLPGANRIVTDNEERNDRNRGIASGIALSGTGLGTLLMPLLARWLIEDEGWRVALILIGLGVAGFGFLASNWIRRPSGLPPTFSSQQSSCSLRNLVRGTRFRQLYIAGFLSSLVLLV